MIQDKVLRGHELFAGLTVDEIHRLSGFASEKEYKAGDTIYALNKPCSHFYMLKQGRVFLLLPGNQPEFSFVISEIEKGELFGVSSLLNSPLYPATAKCYEPTKVLSIEAKPFRGILQANCSAGLDIISRVARIYYTRYLSLLERLQELVSQVPKVR